MHTQNMFIISGRRCQTLVAMFHFSCRGKDKMDMLDLSLEQPAYRQACSLLRSHVSSFATI
jgi:hypothetical protein